MPRFLLVLLGIVFFFYTLWRLLKGEKMTILDWALFFISLVMVGSMASYILQSN